MGSKSSQKPRKPKNKRPTAYFIRRQSHVDDSTWFNHEGRRIRFDKAAWASWLMTNFTSDQKAKVVRAPVLETDMAYQDWLPIVMPENVTADEYLAAIEQTMRDQKLGSAVTWRQARTFLKGMRQQYAQLPRKSGQEKRS